MLLARVFRAAHQPLRARWLLEGEGLLGPNSTGTEAVWLAATCVLESGDAEGALELIGEREAPDTPWESVSVAARMACLRGTVQGVARAMAACGTRH